MSAPPDTVKAAPSAASVDGWNGLAPIAGVIVPFELNGRKSLHLRASAGGDVFGLWDTDNSPDGLATFALRKTEVQVFFEHSTSIHVVPGPDGRTVYTGALGRVDPGGKPLSRLGDWVDFPRMIPSTDTKLYLGVSMPKSDSSGPRIVVTFHENGTDRGRRMAIALRVFAMMHARYWVSRPSVE